jgi:cytidine deaminase
MNAYAPYSQFPVGAALMAADGRVFSGANVENASLGVTMCAERVAVGAAASAGVRSIAAIAVAGGGPDGILPCGACRQVLAEFSLSVTIMRCRMDGSYVTHRLADLLPCAFSGPGIAQDDAQRELELSASS